MRPLRRPRTRPSAEPAFRPPSGRTRPVAIAALFGVVAVVLVATVGAALFIDTHVRAYVQGEGLWSKAQKDATIALLDHASTRHETSWRAYLTELAVIRGDERARIAMEQPVVDMAAVREGFVAGRIDPDRVPGMVWLYRTFAGTPHLRSAVAIWRRGDEMIAELDDTARRIRYAVLLGDEATATRLTIKVRALNERLTRLETAFSLAMERVAAWATQVAAITVSAVVALLMALCALVVGVLVRRSERADRRFRQLFLHAPDAILVTAADGTIVAANPAAATLSGLSLEQLDGRAITAAIGESAAGSGEWRGSVVRPDGSRVLVAGTSAPLDGAEAGLRASIVRDITAGEEATAALGRSEQRLRLLLEQLPAVVWTMGPDLRIASISGRSLATLERTPAEVVGRPIGQLLPAEPDGEAERTYRAALEGRPGRFEAMVAGRRWEVHIEPLRHDEGTVGLLGIALDVSDRRALEERLSHTQRLESLGRLAASVAHDFDNVLTAISVYADLLRESLPRDEAHPEVDEIAAAARRGTRLTRQLLAFGRREEMAPQVVDVGAVVIAMEGMLRRLLGEEIELAVVHERAYRPVVVDPTKLEQIVLNLAVNARDAMPDGGRLVIRVGPGDAVDGRATTRLLVVDDGVGMDAQTRGRIFEPFFTTKTTGHGTGLGLSTVFTIVQQSGGRVEVASAPGVGTTFAIDLPVADAEAATPTPPAPAREPARTVEADAPAPRSILVVDDEPAVRDLAARVLARSGYDVATAADAAGALELLGRKRFDLLLTDVLMPTTNGRDLALAACRERPELRVLYMSGFSAEVLGTNGSQDADVRLVVKPFTAAELLRQTRSALDEVAA